MSSVIGVGVEDTRESYRASILRLESAIRNVTLNGLPEGYAEKVGL